MIKLVDVKKTFGTPPTNVLKGISLDIKDGEFVALTGKSGSGKSTLLYIVSTLDNPSSGEVEISDEKVTQMSQKRLHEFRNEKMGFVFQFHYLLPELTALENVLMPARKTNKQIEKREHAEYLLKEFGLDKKHDRLPRRAVGLGRIDNDQFH
jgi:putative ABC transport system ATP-binding protein/lipoprotein-releasing system ATP-binding protein